MVGGLDCSEYVITAVVRVEYRLFLHNISMARELLLLLEQYRMQER